MEMVVTLFSDSGAVVYAVSQHTVIVISIILSSSQIRSQASGNDNVQNNLNQLKAIAVCTEIVQCLFAIVQNGRSAHTANLLTQQGGMEELVVLRSKYNFELLGKSITNTGPEQRLRRIGNNSGVDEAMVAGLGGEIATIAAAGIVHNSLSRKGCTVGAHGGEGEEGP